MNDIYPMVAKTFGGLEDVLADELESLGALNIEIGKRMVSFEGDLSTMYKANLCCRTALRILKPIVKFTADNPDELYDCVRDVEWEKYIGPNTTISIDSTVNSEDFTHSKYVVYRTKDGIVDHFNDIYGRRPSIRLSGADIQLNVHISDNRVTISIDSSGEPLSRRGYRLQQTQAPINEVLAAGIIMKTGWKGECNFVDPMCGSGTFLIEAALIAANINPGIFRKNFAFEKWPDFNRELFEEIYNDDSEECDFNFKIYGADKDPEAIAITRQNIKNAGVGSMIEIACRSFEDWTEEDVPEEGILITNPPYGERLKSDDLQGLYKSLGRTLKNLFKGYHAWILGYNDDNFAAIGLKASVKFPILNGNLHCELREYVLFDGRYNDFKAEGGTVHNDTFSRGDNIKIRHLSEREWEKETRKFSDKKSRQERKDFKRDKGTFKSDSKNFKPERRKSSKHDDAKSFSRKKDFSKRDFEDRKPRKAKDAILTPDRGPRISKESEIVFSKIPIRSRRKFRKNQNNDDLTND